MSKKANPTIIGLFFAFGLSLGIAGLLLFSSRARFHPKQESILYFDTSLKGLNPGAPVKYRGVTIGTVTDVLIRHNQATNDYSMPVIISIDKTVAQSKSDQQLPIGSREYLDELIRQGFRGRLDAESLVTGVLYVSLDILPKAPPPVFHQLTPEYHEIPTLPSDVQQLLNDLAQLDVSGLSKKLNQLLTRLDTSLGKLDVAAINKGLTNLLESANQLVTTPNITNAIASLRHTLDDAGTLLKRVDSQVDPLAKNANKTLSDAQKTLADLQVGIRNLSNLLNADSGLRPELSQVLEELTNASRAVADLAEFLERHPNSLLTGRKVSKDKP